MTTHRTIFCTTVSGNYLHYAALLRESLARYHPESGFATLVTDSTPVPDGSVGTLVRAEELGIPHLDRQRFRYAPIEYVTSLKPAFMRHLLRSGGWDRVVFLDPDVFVMADLHEVLDALSDANALLTPSMITASDNEQSDHWACQALHTGVFNTGFVGVRRTVEAERFLAWWDAHLRRNCLGMTRLKQFTDQKAIDLAPALFEGVRALRHPGANVGLWNFWERNLRDDGGTLFAGAVPVLFLHYSGFKTSGFTPGTPVGGGPEEIPNPCVTRHRVRVAAPASVRLPSSAEETIMRILERLDQLKRMLAPPAEYPFSKMASGRPIHHMTRMAFHWDPDLQAVVSQPFTDHGMEVLNRIFCNRARWEGFLNKPIVGALTLRMARNAFDKAAGAKIDAIRSGSGPAPQTPDASRPHESMFQSSGNPAHITES